MEEAQSAKLICEWLQHAGYKALLSDSNLINSAAAGLKFQVLPYKSSIQYRCYMTGGPGLDADFVNQTNRAYRFLKAYLDDDGDIIMESDWWMDLGKSDAAELFTDSFEMWELALATLAQATREARWRHESADEMSANAADDDRTGRESGSVREPTI